MARSFNGTSDRIDWSNIWNPQSDSVTYSLWVRWDGTTQYGYMLNISESDDTGGCLIGTRNAASGDITMFRNTGAGGFFRDSVGGVLVANTWVHILATATTSLTVTDIHIYKNGVEVSYSGSFSSGSITSKSGIMNVGGRFTDNTRNFSGVLAEIGMWSEVASTGMIAGLAAGYSPLFYPTNRKGYIPLVRDIYERVTGTNGTLDGTTVISHVPIIYPASISIPSLSGLPPVPEFRRRRHIIGPM